MPLGEDSNDKNNPIEKVNLFLISCCKKALNSTVRSHSMKVRHDHVFDTYRFFLTGLESLQTCFKNVPSVESCRPRLTP